jgi:hypothetical protein
MTVKKTVIKKFFEGVDAIFTKGNMKNVAHNEIKKPTTVFAIDSINDCFLVCFIYICI